MTVEIVGCSVEDCLAITRAGADRIELCGGIVAGGVTPSSAMYRLCRASTPLPIMVMIRPREGGFCYSPEEYDVMLREVDDFAEMGAHGVVFGILQADGSIDHKRMAALRARAGSMEAMCHRAFDVTPDPLVALDQLVDAGFQRVLSSGQTSEITRGLDRLEQIMEHADGRIEVQPCEGIRPDNVREVIRRLNPTSIHLGPFLSVSDPTSALGTEVNYGTHRAIDEACVSSVVKIAKDLA